MKTRIIVIAFALIAPFVVSTTLAWAGMTVKFVNHSSKPVVFKMQVMMPPASWSKDQDFTVPAGQTKNVQAEWPCIKAIWIDGVKKFYNTANDKEEWLCLHAINLVLMIKADGTAEVSQQ